MRRLEIRESYCYALVDYAAPEYVNDAALVALSGDPASELRLRDVRVVSVALEQLVPVVDL
ncbi:MAG: hypothetical protein ACR2G2_15385 [Pseudonocardia sp.]